MTTAPARPSVHSYEGENPFDIVDSAWGSIERWRAVALATGEVGALASLSKQVRSDAIATMDDIEAREAALNARDDAICARERQHAVSVARFTDFVGKAAVLFDRMEKARADQQEEPIARPPGDPSSPSQLPEPVLEVEGDAIPGKAFDTPSVTDGDFLRLKHSVTSDQAEVPDAELPHPPVVQQPIAAGLDQDDQS
jgi:hypothetical protein